MYTFYRIPCCPACIRTYLIYCITALLSAFCMQVNLVLAVDCLFPYACLYVGLYSYGLLSVCLYMSLSVLVFILVYVLSCILSAYSPDYIYGLYTSIGHCISYYSSA